MQLEDLIPHRCYVMELTHYNSSNPWLVVYCSIEDEIITTYISYSLQSETLYIHNDGRGMLADIEDFVSAREATTEEVKLLRSKAYFGPLDEYKKIEP